MIGVGIVTCGRPGFYAQVRASLTTGFDELFVYEDGSPDFGYTGTGDGASRGVGAAKNILFRQMLDAGCDWLFVIEDDILVTSSRVFDEYIGACEESGYEHLSFHGHGPYNPTPLGANGRVTLWPNYVGAFCVYSRESLETCGLLDEGFHNAWEHVEHTLRLAQEGFTAPWRGAADATGSERWLAEIPGAIEHSVIRRDPEWTQHMEEGKRHWKATHPDTYHLVF